MAARWRMVAAVTYSRKYSLRWVAVCACARAGVVRVGQFVAVRACASVGTAVCACFIHRSGTIDDLELGGMVDCNRWRRIIRLKGRHKTARDVTLERQCN